MRLRSAATLVPRMARLAIGCAAALLTAAPAAAQTGDLLVAPTRVVFSGGGSTEVILSNIGSAPATYRISLELRRMTEKGDLVDVAEADADASQKAALAMIRYAPRRVVIAPGLPQSIRLTARPDPALPDGEYRVHMLLRGVPAEAPVEDPGKPAAAPADPKSVSIKLIPIYGITIPVIVRKGTLQASAGIANPHLVTDNGHPALALDLTRAGNRSVFGEIRVLPVGGGTPVAITRGIAIYPEITHRSALLTLTPEQADKLKAGRWRIEYRELAENGGGLLASLDSALR